MRRFILSAVIICFSVSAFGASLNLITEAQSYVTAALTELKFELVPSTVIGGPQKYKVTRATVDHLQKLLHDGKTVTVESNGSIKVE